MDDNNTIYKLIDLETVLCYLRILHRNNGGSKKMVVEALLTALSPQGSVC